MQERRHIDQEVYRFDSLGMVHQSALERNTGVSRISLIAATEVSIFSPKADRRSRGELTDEQQKPQDPDQSPNQLSKP